MDSPLVRINTDPTEKIAKLYGIGPHLAERIVEYRGTHGYFHRPEDLALVKGISSDLAITLAPHIDWEVPDEAGQPEGRDWSFTLGLVALGCFFLIVQCHVFRETTSSLRASVFAQQLGDPIAWIDLWFHTSVLAFRLCLNFAGLAFLLAVVSHRSAQAKWLFRMFVFLAGAAMLSMISGGLGKAVYYQYYAPGGWTELLEDPWTLLSMADFSYIALVVVPISLVLWRPTLCYNPWVARSLDVALVVMLPLSAWAIWVRRHDLPIWMAIPFAVLGSLMSYIGLYLLRTGESFPLVFLGSLVSSVALRQQAKTNAWLAWINARLPSPEQQRALKQALDQAYPPSKWRTLASAIVLGAGSWLVLTAISAIIQWLMEGLLNQLLPWFR